MALAAGALRFGDFTLKSGRRSPYFFNAGVFSDGASLQALGGFYRAALDEAGLGFDMLFGSAYKGIVLAAALAIAYAASGRNVPFAYDRKEDKDHGEGGRLVGAPLGGRVLIVDDVLSAGTSARRAIAAIGAAGASPAGLAVALDRQERGLEAGAAAELESAGVPVVSIARLDDLADYLEPAAGREAEKAALLEYRRHWRCN